MDKWGDFEKYLIKKIDDLGNKVDQVDGKLQLKFMQINEKVTQLDKEFTRKSVKQSTIFGIVGSILGGMIPVVGFIIREKLK